MKFNELIMNELINQNALLISIQIRSFGGLIFSRLIPNPTEYSKHKIHSIFVFYRVHDEHELEYLKSFMMRSLPPSSPCQRKLGAQ